MTIYRSIIKEKKKTFDNKIVENVENFLKNFKNEKNTFDYRIYSKVIKAAEYYEFALRKSNQREMTLESLKYSKDLLKIGYGLKPTPRWNSESVKLLKKIENNAEILNKVEKFSEGSHEVLAYRMALSVPSRFTASEHELLQPKTQYVRN